MVGDTNQRGASFSLVVDDAILGTLTVQGEAEIFIFKFKPTTPAPSSGSDTLWTIVRWEENGAVATP